MKGNSISYQNIGSSTGVPFGKYGFPFFYKALISRLFKHPVLYIAEEIFLLKTIPNDLGKLQPPRFLNKDLS